MILTVAMTTAALSLATYVTLCGIVAQRFTTARRRAPPSFITTTAAAPQQVSFEARDGRARIDGWYMNSRDTPPDAPAVVFVHGKDACRGDELRVSTFALAQAFVAAGLAVLMIDLRGHGTSSPARMTYGARERFDVLGATDWLRQHGHARIGVLGASMGASTALLAAAAEPGIRAIVADSPFADFDLMIRRQYHKLSGLPGWVLPGALLLIRLLTGENVRLVRPLDHAGLLQQRAVLVIHSEGDRFIPADDGRLLARAMGAECWITASEGHIGSYRAAPLAYTERVLGFFSSNLLCAQMRGARTVPIE